MATSSFSIYLFIFFSSNGTPSLIKYRKSCIIITIIIKLQHFLWGKRHFASINIIVSQWDLENVMYSVLCANVNFEGYFNAKYGTEERGSC